MPTPTYTNRTLDDQERKRGFSVRVERPSLAAIRRNVPIAGDEDDSYSREARIADAYAALARTADTASELEQAGTEGREFVGRESAQRRPAIDRVMTPIGSMAAELSGVAQAGRLVKGGITRAVEHPFLTGMDAASVYPAARLLGTTLKSLRGFRSGLGAKGAFSAIPRTTPPTVTSPQTTPVSTQMYRQLGQRRSEAGAINAAVRGQGDYAPQAKSALEGLRESGKLSRGLRSMSVVDDLPVAQGPVTGPGALSEMAKLRSHLGGVPTSRARKEALAGVEDMGTSIPPYNTRLTEMIERGGPQEWTPEELARITAGLGDDLEAQRWLEESASLKALAGPRAAGHMLPSKGRPSATLYDTGTGPMRTAKQAGLPEVPLTGEDLRPLMFQETAPMTPPTAARRKPTTRRGR